MRRVKSEEHVADLVTKPFSKGVIAKHCFALVYVNMAEENGQCKVQGVAMFWDFGSIQMFLTGVRTACRTQQVTMSRRIHKEPEAAASGLRAGDQ